MSEFTDKALIERINFCYKEISGKTLPCPKTITDENWWLHHAAPFSLLAHSWGADPQFIYANECALKCFKYSREEILRLPSRLSAASPEQQERQQVLSKLESKGIVRGYSGMRITSQGELFRIYNGVIWQLKNNDGTFWGQGAIFWLSPDGCEQHFET